MAKPILLSVDDDSDVLRTIERDLRLQYGAEYRVIGSDTPEKALDLLKQMRVRNDSVALLLADQRPKGWALERDPFLLETNVPVSLPWAMCGMVRSNGWLLESAKDR
jgi:hypothetical protein